MRITGIEMFEDIEKSKEFLCFLEWFPYTVQFSILFCIQHTVVNLSSGLISRKVCVRITFDQIISLRERECNKISWVERETQISNL